MTKSVLSIILHGAKGAYVMKITLILLTTFLSLTLQGKEQIGFYEVPRPDGQIINYQSTIVFEGESLIDASQFTINFPKELTGIENSIVINKTSENTWEGRTQLLEKVQCQTNTMYDFSCELVFNKKSVVDLTEVSHSITKNNSDRTLFVDKGLARENLLLQAFSLKEIETHLISTDIFASEPIGFLKYRKVYPTN